MIGPILSVILLFSLGYFLMYQISDQIRMKTSTDQTYHLKTDVTIYILAIMFVTAIAVYFAVPDFSDILVPLPFFKIIVPFICAGLIYGVFLMEMKRFVEITAVFCAIVCGFVFIKPESLIFQNYIPPYLEILCLSMIAGVIALSGKVLTGIHGLFSLFVLMFMLGLLLFVFIGGFPMIFAFWAAVCCGIWVVVFQFNMYDENLLLNKGSAISVMFLIGCLFLIAVNELTFSSVLILTMYPLTALVWALICMCFLKNESPDLYMYTAFYQTYLKGVDARTLHTLLFKLLMINILFALIQLYAPNIFTFPVLTVVFNFWMFSKLYHSGEEEISLREAGQKITEDIKKQIKNLKNINKKD